MMCESCERGDHANCGMQTWCECDCDPEAIDYFEVDPGLPAESEDYD